MRPSLRPATVADIDRLVALERACGVVERTADAYAHELSLVWSRVVVLEMADEGVIGAAVFWTIENEVELHWIVVHPEHRRRGFARDLLDALFVHARSIKGTRVLLEVRRSNTSAQALYRNYGFGEIGVRKGYYQGDGEDAIVMEVRLAAGAT